MCQAATQVAFEAYKQGYIFFWLPKGRKYFRTLLEKRETNVQQL